MNDEDSEKLSGMLKRIGHKKTENRDDADIIIFNTCCVRENAELKAYGNLGMLRKLKIKKPNLIIAVCGCMMQQKGMAEDIIRRFPFVDIIFGTHNSYKFPEYLSSVLNNGKSIIEIQSSEENIIEGIPIERDSSIKAFVTIMYGCNNFCTYCIVPFVRGRERSRKPEDIENEIKNLISQGYKEITLLGQNVNSYGKGLEEKINFAKLLYRLNEIQGLERIRFMTSHPKDLTDDVIEAVASLDKVCEHIHLPVQSGSSKILSEMNRHYDREQYISLINKIKTKIPSAAISTDIIVGFPGETEEDFLETLSLISSVQFDLVFTFIYSKRKYTPAEKIEPQISEEVKHERFNRLIEVVNKICASKNKKYEGNIEEILVEGLSKNDENKLNGRTRSGKLVNFIGDDCDIGKVIKVKITKTNSFSLGGEEIKWD